MTRPPSSEEGEALGILADLEHGLNPLPMEVAYVMEALRKARAEAWEEGHPKNHVINGFKCECTNPYQSTPQTQGGIAP